MLKDELSIWDKYSEKLEPLRTEHYAKDEPSANFESFGDRKNGLEKRKFEDDRIRPKQSESEIRIGGRIGRRTEWTESSEIK